LEWCTIIKQIQVPQRHIDQDDGSWYTACPCEGCNKKVIQSLADMWQCEKCNHDYPSCNRRYMLSASVADHSGTTWVTLFDEQVQQLLGHSAEEMHELKMSGDEAGYEGVFAAALFKQVCLKLRVKQDMVNDEPRMKSSAASYAPVDFAAESKQLMAAITKYD
jgi:replication factor A1